jgi:ABC-type multidrug transport system fused ATPase/permease subunit
MAMHGYNEEDDVIGKAYDAQLVGRLSGYMRPYAWRVAMALMLLLASTVLTLLQPVLVQQAIDRDIAKGTTDSLWWRVHRGAAPVLHLQLRAVAGDGRRVAKGDE